MPRVKGGNVAKNRRRKVLKLAKGYYGSKHLLFRTAHEQVMHSLAYAYNDRKRRKRDFRKLWITRINAAARINGLSYSRLINGLNLAGIEVNRKMLADIAVNDAAGFAQIAELAKKALKFNATLTTAAPVVKTAPVAKEAPVEKVEAENIIEMTVVELKALAKERGIEGYSSMLKADLIDAFMTVVELKAIAKEKGIEGYSSMLKAELVDALK